MATGQPASPDTNSGNEADSVAPLEHQAGGSSLDQKALADRRVEIEESGIFKLHLKDWEDAKKQDLLKIESYRGRCIAAKTELYQLMGFYSLFQGVVLSAVSNGSKLSCQTAIFPFMLSLLTSIATAVSIHVKLTFYKTEKLKFIKAECDVNNLIKKINKLKGQGKHFKFEEIDDPNSDSNQKAKTQKRTDAMKVLRLFYTAVMSFLVVFSCIILISCIALRCAKQN